MTTALIIYNLAVAAPRLAGLPVLLLACAVARFRPIDSNPVLHWAERLIYLQDPRIYR